MTRGRLTLRYGNMLTGMPHPANGRAMLDAREALVTQRDRRVVGYDQALELVKKLEAAVLRDKPDLLVGILRSGAIPALMLSQRIEVPVVFCCCNRADTHPTFPQGTEFAGRRVLVVDDIASTGRTLARVKAAVQNAGGTCQTMALFYDARSSIHPDHGHKAQQFIHFVWEKLEVTPASRRLYHTQNNRYAPTDVSEYYGFDVDGMLLHGAQGAALDAALAEIKRWDAQDTVLVSARALGEFDISRLAGWDLHKHRRVACGGDTPDACPVATKVRHIQTLGISTWYESDVEQALQISRACPVTDVVLWRHQGAMRVSVADVF